MFAATCVEKVCGVADEMGALDEQDDRIDMDEYIAEALEIESEGESVKEIEVEDEVHEEGIAAKGIKSPQETDTSTHR